MQKKTANIIIALVVLILIAGGILFYFYYLKGESAGSPYERPVGLPQTSFPEGSGGGGEGQGGENGGSDGGASINQNRLMQITDVPVSGAITLKRDEKTYVRYIERGEGRVFETALDVISPVRISNTTIPKISEAKWFSGGNSLLIRRFDEEREGISTFFASISSSEGEEGALEGVFLTPNIQALSISPDSKKIFYLVQSGTGVAGIESEPNGTKKAQIFESPLREWNVYWPSSNTIALSSKAGANSFGSLFFLNRGSGKLESIISGVPGLMVSVSPANSFVIYSQISNGQPSTAIWNVSKKERTPLPAPTLPAEKCVWTKNGSLTAYCGVPTFFPQGSYPDFWYQGKVSLSDDIWKIDAETGLLEFVASLQEKDGIDVIDPSLSEDGSYLIFTNKKDLTLWSLKLE